MKKAEELGNNVFIIEDCDLPFEEVSPEPLTSK